MRLTHVCSRSMPIMLLLPFLNPGGTGGLQRLASPKTCRPSVFNFRNMTFISKKVYPAALRHACTEATSTQRLSSGNADNSGRHHPNLSS